MGGVTTIYQRPVEVLQHLVRFDTTNPPGDEGECIAYIDGLLQSVGIETTLLEKAPGRPNLIARLKGEGKSPPLLLYGHVDVVTTAGQDWTHPPFEARIVDGYVWGRGTLDMKGGVVMMVAAFMRAKAEDLSLPGDVILTILSDEEAGSDAGAKFLVEAHAELFEGVRYALGEFGGFTFYVGGRRFYPIMVAEKQICWMKATVRGPAGHGSMPLRGPDSAMAKLTRLLETLNTKRLPVHVTPVARAMVTALRGELPFPMSALLGQLLRPVMTDRVLDLMGEQGRVFDPLFHHTVSPNIVYGGDKINVIPAEITVELDGRLLPGYTPDDMLSELRTLLEEDVDLEVVRHQPGPPESDIGLYDTLATILRESDPGGTPMPLLVSGVTDGCHFARLGIQTYGFLPMRLPEDFNFTRTIHAADERIPVEAVVFGANAIHEALRRFGDAEA